MYIIRVNTYSVGLHSHQVPILKAANDPSIVDHNMYLYIAARHPFLLLKIDFTFNGGKRVASSAIISMHNRRKDLIKEYKLFDLDIYKPTTASYNSSDKTKTVKLIYNF